MKRSKGILFSMVIIAGLLTIVGCIQKASDGEIDQACQQMVKLQGDQTPEDASDLATKCKQDLKRENVSSKNAQCRSKAANLDTFWNKCR